MPEAVRHRGFHPSDAVDGAGGAAVDAGAKLGAVDQSFSADGAAGFDGSEGSVVW